MLGRLDRARLACGSARAEHQPVAQQVGQHKRDASGQCQPDRDWQLFVAESFAELGEQQQPHRQREQSNAPVTQKPPKGCLWCVAERPCPMCKEAHGGSDCKAQYAGDFFRHAVELDQAPDDTDIDAKAKQTHAQKAHGFAGSFGCRG